MPSEGWAEQQDSLLLLLGACQAENVLSLDEKCLISGISRWNGEPVEWRAVELAASPGQYKPRVQGSDQGERTPTVCRMGESFCHVNLLMATSRSKLNSCLRLSCVTLGVFFCSIFFNLMCFIGFWEEPEPKR